MNETKRKNRIYFFFSLIFTFLISTCGIRNFHGFPGEDARFVNYRFLANDSNGLAYYADDTNPNEIAVAIGSCTAEEIRVSTYDEVVDGETVSHPVTSVYPSGFQNCSTIKKITLPDTVVSFGTDAFAGSSLESITIPKDLSVIASGSFRNCKELQSVSFKKGNQLRAISDYAFANCYNLAVFQFYELENLKTIGKEAFLYCIELTSVVFFDGFNTLESYAFQDCKKLTTIYFPASTTYVGANAFRGVGKSAKIYFSNREPGSSTSSSSSNSDGSADSSVNPLSLADGFNFSYDTYYIPVVFDVGPMKYEGDFQYTTPGDGKYPVKNCSASKDESGWHVNENVIDRTEQIAKNEVIVYGYTGPGGNITIPTTILDGAFKVVGIKNEAFLNNATITGVTFGENLRFIDYGAFSGCTKIKTIDLAGAFDLEHIESRAFFNTMNSSGGSNADLYSVHIPPNVISIASDAFRSCDGLFRLYFDGATSKYEEAFVCAKDGVFEFELGYIPSGTVKVTFDGPEIASNAYTVTGKKITIASARKGGVARVKYTTNSTTTQTFIGQLDENDLPVSEFVLAAKTDVIASVIVGNQPKQQGSDFTIDNTDQDTTKIVFTSAPAKGVAIVVSYRAPSKLTTIGDYAFYGCAPGFANKTFPGKQLRQTDNPFSNIYFPASLTAIGQYAFSSGQFIGGVEFSSSSLTINQYAFSEQKALSSIVFPDEVTELILGSKCFASGLSDYGEIAAGNLYKKLISVTLPENTTVTGNELFYGHLFLSIYCIGSTPSGIETYKKWNRTASDDKDSKPVLETFGSFSSNATKNEMDTAPYYTVDEPSDIVTLPSEEYPIFDFVKESDKTSATLTNYHYYGGRIKDQYGHPAIVMDSTYDLTTNDENAINSAFDSDYLVKTGDGHFSFEIPYKVYFGETRGWLNVTKIGKAALAVQFNNQTMHPRGDSPSSTSADAPNSNATKYWKSTENFWTMKEIHLPHCITIIDDIAMAFVPFTTVKSYGVNDITPTADNKAYISSGDNLSGEGEFPSSLTEIRKKAFVFSAIKKAKLPDCLEVFGDTGSSGPNMSQAYYYFPFMGCFELSDLEIYTPTGSTVEDPVFLGPEGEGVITHKDGAMIEGASARDSISIPWGTTTMVAGALRGGRKIKNVLFPYTLEGISDNFLDTIGNARDSQGRSGKSDLQTVQFGGLAAYPGKVDENAPDVPACTIIGKSAFYGARNLNSFEFPVGLQVLGQWSFIDCGSLVNITVDTGTSDTDNDPSSHLNFSELPNVTAIGQECFKNCKLITKITTSSSLTKIGSNANNLGTQMGNGESVFSGCKGLTALNLNSETKTLTKSCFYGCENLPSVTFNTTAGNELGASCFENCSKITSITFNGTKNTIGQTCFKGCSLLNTINFNVPQNQTKIQDNAFENCTSLSTLSIPTGCTLSKQVFKGCSSLNTIVIESGVKFSGQDANGAFIGCPQGASIFLMDSPSAYTASGNYPSGWNCWDYSGSSGQTLATYCHDEEHPTPSGATVHNWHYVNGVPTPW